MWASVNCTVVLKILDYTSNLWAGSVDCLVQTKLNSSWISNCHRVLNVVFFLLGDSPASEFYVSTFRNTVCPIFIGGGSRENSCLHYP